jgi:hypothetical protein
VGVVGNQVGYFDQDGNCISLMTVNAAIVEGIGELGFYGKNIVSDLSPLDILNTVYLTEDKQLAYRSKRPSENHHYVDGVWVIDIIPFRKSEYNILKVNLYRYIVKDSHMPMWKQVNLLDIWAELSIKSITSATGLTLEEQASLDYSASVRSWKNNLLSERDRVKGEIEIAESEAEIVSAIASFHYVDIPTSKSLNT